MRELFLTLAVIAMFAFSFFVVGRIGGFLEANYLGAGAKKPTDRNVCVTFAEGASAAETAHQIRRLSENYNRCAVIVCTAPDPDILDYFDAEWCAEDSQYRIG